MRLPTHRPRYAAVLVVAALALTGCSTGHDTDSAASAASSGTTPTADAFPSTAATAASPQPRPTGMDHWPTYPAAKQDVPTGVKSAVMAKGYTGQSFLEELAADWHITLGKRQKLTFSEPARQVGGEAHPTKNSALQVAAIWDLSGDLRQFYCSATANAPRYEEFLRACIGLDHPGSDAKAAAAWLDGVKPQVDKAFTKEKVPITSPLLRSGNTAAYLRKGAYSPSGTYQLEIFGTSDARN
ncbi:hypothetical protein ABTZ93_03760 [Streptomyces sp. NPDC097941]|uniref:hypothetical protein n=1 Tax=Streptomyces sp. NPDC097941 TaxID=3155685 RepID=UPI003320379D